MPGKASAFTRTCTVWKLTLDMVKLRCKGGGQLNWSLAVLLKGEELSPACEH